MRPPELMTPSKWHASRMPGVRHITDSRATLLLYHIWRQIKFRCTDVRCKQYNDYGGRGNYICEQWKTDFWTFHDDVSPRPEGFWLDRIDNDDGYRPGNVRWVTPTTSNSNRRNCIYLEHDGERVTLKEYMRRIGRAGDYRMVTKRIRKGHSVQSAIHAPRRIWPNASKN